MIEEKNGKQSKVDTKVKKRRRTKSSKFGIDESSYTVESADDRALVTMEGIICTSDTPSEEKFRYVERKFNSESERIDQMIHELSVGVGFDEACDRSGFNREEFRARLEVDIELKSRIIRAKGHIKMRALESLAKYVEMEDKGACLFMVERCDKIEANTKQDISFEKIEIRIDLGVGQSEDVDKFIADNLYNDLHDDTLTEETGDDMIEE